MAALGLNIQNSEADKHDWSKTVGILNKLKSLVSTPSADDADLYAAIAREIEQGYRREGLWAIALTEAEFDELKAQTIYMRMAVKDLRQELRQQAQAEENRKIQLMNSAYGLFDEDRYEEAAEGLLLLLERKNDHVAGACLGFMFWYGEGVEKDEELGLELLGGAEQSTNPGARRFIGSLYEYIDWKKSLSNYNYAAENGDTEAKKKAKALTKRLKSEGVMQKNFLEKLFD